MIKLANFLFLKDITLAVKENIDYIKNRITKVFNIINDSLKKKYGVNTSISMGVTFKTNEIKTFDDLYSKADSAMYERKRNGKDGVAFYN